MSVTLTGSLTGHVVFSWSDPLGRFLIGQSALLELWNRLHDGLAATSSHDVQLRVYRHLFKVDLLMAAARLASATTRQHLRLPLSI
jgi:hypothetical protein